MQKIAAIIIAAGLLFTGTVVFAETDTSSSLSRLQASAKSQNLTLDESTKQNLQSSCEPAQENLRSIRQRELKLNKTYLSTYQSVQNEISALEIRLKRQGTNVQGVDRIIMAYKEHTDRYDRLSQVYEQALVDTTNIDCKQNPTEFMAGVVLVRQTRAQLFEVTKTTKQFVGNDVQQQFDIVKNELSV